jgi:hypothetical protein
LAIGIIGNATEYSLFEKCLVFVFALMWPFITHGQESGNRPATCKEIRLDSPGKAFERIPVYNQTQYSVSPYDKQSDSSALEQSLSGQNLCYAMASAAMMDANRFKNGDSLSKLTSPLSVALNHKANFKKIEERQLAKVNLGGGDDYDQVLGPGNPIFALVTNNNMRVCDQRWLEQYSPIMAPAANANGNSDKQKSIETFLKEALKQINDAHVLKENITDKTSQNYCDNNPTGNNLSQIGMVMSQGLNPPSQISELSTYLDKLCKDHSNWHEPKGLS